jgi:hypothetical protein
MFINAWRRILWSEGAVVGTRDSAVDPDRLGRCAHTIKRIMDERPTALTETEGLMNQEVIVGLIIVLAVGFILAKLVGGASPSNPSASEDD